MTYAFERQNRAQEEGIQSFNYGGINTTASQLNCPFTDSPAALNVITNESGHVVKRKGTELLYHAATTSVANAYLTNFTTGLQYNILVAKISTAIHLYETVDGVTTQVMVKPNVWDNAAASLKPMTVRTNEIEPRLIFTIQNSKPVQLRFTEAQTTKGFASSSVVFNDAERFKNSTTSNTIVFVDRVRVSAPTISYDSGTKQLTVGNLPNGTVVDIILVTWQWWAEALFWRGDRFWRAKTRFNSSPLDQVIENPSTIISDMSSIGANYSSYPIVLYKQSTGLVSFTNVPNGKPQTSDEWAYSDGARYIYSVNDYVNPSPFFVTFGALVSGGQPTVVYYARRRELRFRNGEGLTSGAHLDVYMNKYKSQKHFAGHSFTTQYGDVWMFKTDTAGNIVSCISPTDKVNWVSFETTQAGVPTDAKVELINSERVHIGSASLATRFDYNDGSYVPIFGIGLYADYKNGYYPGDCSIYQDRLVLADFPHTPFTVAISATADSVVPGEYYNFFQVTDDLVGLPTDPFDITIAGDPKDYVVKTMEWQQQLFIFTRYNTFRASGGQANVITPTTKGVSLVSTVGCVNKHAITKTDTTILFMSDIGIHSIVARDNFTEYLVAEASIKIRDHFGVTKEKIYESLGWLGYDPTTKFVYACLPVEGFTRTARRLMVFNTFRESWSEYDCVGGFHLFHGAPFIDRRRGNRFCAFCVLHWDTSGVPNRVGIIQFDGDKFVDFYNTVDRVVGHIPDIVYTTANHQQIYAVEPPTSTSLRSFRRIPSSSVLDMEVLLDGQLLEYRKDWYKLPTGEIYLAANPGDGKPLLIRPRMTLTDSKGGQGTTMLNGQPLQNGIYQLPFIVFVNGVINRVVNAFRLVDSTDKTEVLNWTQAPPIGPNTKVAVGYAYPSFYTSPFLNLETLAHIKKLNHLFLHFDNKEIADVFKASDVNVSDNQDPTEIVDGWKQRGEGSVVVVHNDMYEGDYHPGIYGYGELHWDDLLFDVDSTGAQFYPSQLVKLPVEGSGYGFQFILFNFDDGTFKMSGYQVKTVVQRASYVYNRE